MSLEDNKAIVAIFDASSEHSEQYDQITKELETVGAGNPIGRLYHVAYAKDGGYIVVDVWESDDLFEQFSLTLADTIKRMGGNPGKPQIYPVHNIVS